jgi:hypothetical protein
MAIVAECLYTATEVASNPQQCVPVALMGSPLGYSQYCVIHVKFLLT